MRIILASGSPRRRELLTKIYPRFEVITSDADENIDEVNPGKMVSELAFRKAKAVYDSLNSEELSDFVIIGADTLVFYDGEVLGKPADEDDAKGMLSMLSDRTHQVYTGVAVLYKKAGDDALSHFTFSDCTDVTFYEIDKFDIADYIKSGSPMDKAGAYGIQDEFAKHVRKINGDYNNVVGLPVAKLYQELKNNKLT